MKIKDLLLSASRLVASRDIIEHGSIRCLYSERSASEISSAEGCEEVDTSTVGDDELSAELAELANSEQVAEIRTRDLYALERAFRGEEIADYIDAEAEDELISLDKLIEAARELF